MGISPIESSITVNRSPVVIGLSELLTATVSLSRVDVLVSGALPRLDALGAADVRVMLDLTGLAPGSHVVVPVVVAPEGVRVEGVIPQAIEVVIESLAPPDGLIPSATPDSSVEEPLPVSTPSN